MQHFERAGLVFDVRDSGPPDGDTVVLLHGFPQDGSSFDRVAPGLHAAGLRTLAPDQRGYSPGARPAGRSAYRTAECVEDVIALLDAAGVDRAHVVGHDWGGAVAWGLAGLFPDRVRSLVVLSTPHPAALTRSFVTSAQGLRSWYMALFQLPWLPELLVAPMLGRSLQDSGLPAADADRYARRMREPGALSAALNWYRAMPFSLRSPIPPSTVPTTYAWGRSDFALGRAAAGRTRDHVTGPYRFAELDAGHWLPETRPDEVVRLVLDRVR